ncbi:hypothetical protein PC9H_002744 [Pleurotus ostreatus]|uniref:Uncharacterized protein n=1 Tax=Pleurotus ostreatus TaxID=5322 RepID=A0A8H6ZLA2_PLEOS|nr:uncharacterized protein PC9H_002744 [Pleurotus ostreatus]KAF7416478.1 hypothetical protein PC9H_002744 [Pleurotus ostreatus]
MTSIARIAFLAGHATHDDDLPPLSTQRPSWPATLRAQTISPPLSSTAFLAGHATHANDLPASLLNGLPGRPRYARKRSPRLSPQRPSWQASLRTTTASLPLRHGLPGRPRYARKRSPRLSTQRPSWPATLRAQTIPPASLLNGLPGRPAYARRRSPPPFHSTAFLAGQPTHDDSLPASTPRPSWPATLRTQTISPPFHSTTFLAGHATRANDPPRLSPQRPSWQASLRTTTASLPLRHGLPGWPRYARKRSPRLSTQRPSRQASLRTTTTPLRCHSTTFLEGHLTHDDLPAFLLNGLPGRPRYTRRLRTKTFLASHSAIPMAGGARPSLNGLLGRPTCPLTSLTRLRRGRRPRSTAFHSVGILPVCMFIEIWQLREPRPSPSWTPILRSTCCANSRLDLASTGASQTPTPTYEQRR